jgi:hypothetical protein
MKAKKPNAHDFAGKTGNVSPSEGQERTRKLLAALAGLGCMADLIPMLAAFGGIEISADDRRFVTGPIVVHGNAWMDSVPKWLIPQIQAERTEIVFGLRPGPVGPSELTAVMMPAMHEHPMQHDTADMYLWAAAHAVARHKGAAPIEIWRLCCGDDLMPQDSAYFDRGGRHYQTYWPLADEIRRKVDGAYRGLHPGKLEELGAILADTRPAKKSVTEKQKRKLAAMSNQLSLFGDS